MPSKYSTPALKPGFEHLKPVVERANGKRLDIRKEMYWIVPQYLRGKDGQPFDLEEPHWELLHRMFEGGKFVVNWPTDHLKSDLTTFIFPILSLIENPNESHIICGATLSESTSRVARIEAEITTNHALIREFPWIAKPVAKENRLWKKTQFNVDGRTIGSNNPSVRAASWTSNEIRQSRGKLVMDDLEGPKVRNSPTERQRLYDFITLEAWRCWEDRHETDRPLLMSVGTPFDPDSIYFQLELIGWEVRRFSAYATPEEARERQPDTKKRRRIDGEYEEMVDAMTGEWVRHYSPIHTWPRKAEKVEEARRTMVKEQFNIQYRLDPTGGDPNKLSAQQIIEMMKNATFDEDQVRTFVTLDPAGGSRHRQADYAGLAVVRVSWAREDALPTVDVVEAFAFRQGLFEQVRKCAELAQQHGCPVIYEANSQQGYNYPDTFKHLAGIGHIRLPELIRHYTTDGSKSDEQSGMTLIPTLLKNGRLRVPESQLETDGVVALTKEIRDLGLSGSHDHLLAAIWFAYKRAFEEVKDWVAPQMVNGYVGRYFTPYTQLGNFRQAPRPRRTFR